MFVSETAATTVQCPTCAYPTNMKQVLPDGSFLFMTFNIEKYCRSECNKTYNIFSKSTKSEWTVAFQTDQNKFCFHINSKVFTRLLEKQTVAGKRESTEKLMLLIYSIAFPDVLSLQ